MKVRALKSFVATVDGTKYRLQTGDEIDMPKDADWVNAGLAEKVGRTTKAKKGKSGK